MKYMLIPIIIAIGWFGISTNFVFFRAAVNDTSFTNISAPAWELGLVQLAPLAGVGLLVFVIYHFYTKRQTGEDE